MANEIRNRMTLLGKEEDIQKIIEQVRGPHWKTGKECVLDFNRIKPVPKALAEIGDMSFEAGMAVSYMAQRSGFHRDNYTKEWFEELPEERQETLLDKAKVYLKNMSEYGYATWYDFRTNEWGTKWEAWDVSREGNIFLFTTAWNTPYKVLQKLSRQHPEVVFGVDYADENVGYKAGSYTIVNGKITSEVYPEKGTKEAYDFSFTLWPDRKVDFRLINNVYFHVDDLDENGNPIEEDE